MREKKHLRQVKNIEELREEYKALTGGWSQDTIFMAKSSMFIAEQLVAIRQQLPQLAMINALSAAVTKEQGSNHELLVEIRALTEVLAGLTRTKGRLRRRRAELRREAGARQ